MTRPDYSKYDALTQELLKEIDRHVRRQQRVSVIGEISRTNKTKRDRMRRRCPLCGDPKKVNYMFCSKPVLLRFW